MANSGQIIHEGVVAAPATSTAIAPSEGLRTLQASVVGTGAVTAEIELYGSNMPRLGDGGTHGVLLGTITLSGTTSASDGFATAAPWVWVWSKVTAISGTGATVTVTMGV